MKVCGIYKITNVVNGKCIIGQSRDSKMRWSKYKSLLKRSMYQNPHLQNAWNKYGAENFVFKILLECPIDKLNEEEIRLIKEYKATDREFGYNIDNGGNSHSTSEATKRILSQLNKGKVLSAEHRAKISDSTKGKNNPLYGKTHSEETKLKMSKSQIARFSKSSIKLN